VIGVPDREIRGGSTEGSMERRESDGRKNGTRARVKSTEATALAERTRTLQFPALYDRRPHRTPQGVQNWKHNKKKYKSWAKKNRVIGTE
jgi:hypothetical protein